jgi:hypothetical protein
MDGFEAVQEIAAATGGTIKEVMDFGDGDGGAILSIPLRKDHWIYQKDDTPAGFKSNVPPMPFRMGASSGSEHYSGLQVILRYPPKSMPGGPIVMEITREQFAHAIRAAGKYAVRCATMNGSEMDFDPDAMLQNLVVGFLGYWTETGLTGDANDSKWCDPQAPFDFGPARREPTHLTENTAQVQGCEPTGSAPTAPVPVIRAWHIGEHGEVFAGRCTEEEMKQWYRELVATSTEPDYGNECIAECFEELSPAELDAPIKFSHAMTTYRKEAEGCLGLPCQIATMYN